MYVNIDCFQCYGFKGYNLQGALASSAVSVFLRCSVAEGKSLEIAMGVIVLTINEAVANVHVVNICFITPYMYHVPLDNNNNNNSEDPEKDP